MKIPTEARVLSFFFDPSENTLSYDTIAMYTRLHLFSMSLEDDRNRASCESLKSVQIEAF